MERRMFLKTIGLVPGLSLYSLLGSLLGSLPSLGKSMSVTSAKDDPFGDAPSGDESLDVAMDEIGEIWARFRESHNLTDLNRERADFFRKLEIQTGNTHVFVYLEPEDLTRPASGNSQSVC